MSSTINASTSGVGGVITTADNSGILKLQTAGVDAVTIDASQVATFVNSPVMGVSGLTGNIAAARITTALNASGSAPVYACRAWVNFNGTGTVAISASGNVSSITDLGVGSYSVNLTTAMPDANYSVVGASTSLVGTAVSTVVTTFRRDTDVRVANTTTAAVISTCNTQNSTALDVVDVNVSIFR